jgi:hypothetical protein
MLKDAASYLGPGVVNRIFGRTLAFLVWIGLFRGHLYVLEVRGANSGIWRRGIRLRAAALTRPRRHRSVPEAWVAHYTVGLMFWL